MTDKALGRIRIISDGTLEGTKILDSNGVSIGLVKSLTICIEESEPVVHAMIRIHKPQLDIEAVVLSPTVGRNCIDCEIGGVDKG